MTTKIKIFENDHTYFITFTCYNWLPSHPKTSRSIEGTWRFIIQLWKMTHMLIETHIRSLVSRRQAGV